MVKITSITCVLYDTGQLTQPAVFAQEQVKKTRKRLDKSIIKEFDEIATILTDIA